MSGFEVGDKVRVVKSGGDFAVGTLLTLERRWAGDRFDWLPEEQPEGNWCGLKDEEIELVIDTQKSKRVRVTVEREVKNAGGGDYIDALGGRLWLHKVKFEDKLEFIAEPIVLPTRKNALISINNVTFLFNGNIWVYDFGRTHSTRFMTEVAQKNTDSYRVIFEGEG